MTSMIITPVMPNRDEKPNDQKLSGILTFITLPIRFTAKRVQIPWAAVKNVPKTNFLFLISSIDCAINKVPNSKIRIIFPEFKISLLVFVYIY